MSLGIVRAPFTYKFSDLESFEEPIITYLLGYLSAIGELDYKVYDFHLNRALDLQTIVDDQHDTYVIAVRESVENVHYVQRIARSLSRKTRSRIFIYGQVGRLSHLAWPERAQLVIHDERQLAKVLGICDSGPRYGNGLIAQPYVSFENLTSNQARRFKAGLETSRGCHFPCKFSVAHSTA
jgi:hypothetical protein